MRQILSTALGVILLSACGGQPPAESPADNPEAYEDPPAEEPAAAEGTSETSEPAGENEFALGDSDTAAGAQGVTASKIKPSATEAAMKFFVVDKDKGPIVGVVIAMEADGKKYYTGETDAKGYAEVLVPVGKKYALTYLSLGRRDITAQVPVPDEPNQNIKLTLRYKNKIPKKKPGDKRTAEPGFILKGVQFDTGKATIRSESLPRLDEVVEYMTHKKSSKIEITGHTDNVGVPANNKKLSQRRADACRDYLVSKGIDGSRITAVGYGDEQPIADNDSEEGRQMNRRIEAREL